MGSNKILVSTDEFLGEFRWNQCLQTYTFNGYPFGSNIALDPVSVGNRFSEFISPDLLINYLRAIGIKLTDNSVGEIFLYRDELSKLFGNPFLIGERVANKHRLFIKTQSGPKIEVFPKFLIPEHGWTWGNKSMNTIETASAIYTLLISPVFSSEAASFSYLFTHDFLAFQNNRFEIDIYSICDWFQTDSDLILAESHSRE